MKYDYALRQMPLSAAMCPLRRPAVASVVLSVLATDEALLSLARAIQASTGQYKPEKSLGYVPHGADDPSLSFVIARRQTTLEGYILRSMFADALKAAMTGRKLSRSYDVFSLWLLFGENPDLGRAAVEAGARDAISSLGRMSLDRALARFGVPATVAHFLGLLDMVEGRKPAVEAAS